MLTVTFAAVSIQLSTAAPYSILDILTVLGFILTIVGIWLGLLAWLRPREWAFSTWHSFLKQARTYWAAPIAAILAALILWLDQSHRRGAASVLFVATIFALVTWCQHLLSRNKSLATRIPWEKDDPNHRWEELPAITYGCLPYEDFMDDARFGVPTGFGMEMLKILFEPEIKRDKEFLKIGEWVNWGNVLKELTNKKYRIVATPLFATFDRSKDARFTAPLFYSNIGLYVSSKTARNQDWGEEKLGFKEMCEIMKSINNNEICLLSVEGEISAKLAKKYAHQDSIQGRADTVTLSEQFAEIAKPKANPATKIKPKPSAMFCESYFGSQQNEVKNGEVINVLALHQILYPVCFAVRVGDYQLANLLNIRLLAQARKKHPLDLLIDNLVPSNDNERARKISEIKKHFLAEWPVPNQTEGGLASTSAPVEVRTA